MFWTVYTGVSLVMSLFMPALLVPLVSRKGELLLFIFWLLNMAAMVAYSSVNVNFYSATLPLSGLLMIIAGFVYIFNTARSYRERD